jgi:hypothetical protein
MAARFGRRYEQEDGWNEEDSDRRQLGMVMGLEFGFKVVVFLKKRSVGGYLSRQTAAETCGISTAT